MWFLVFINSFISVGYGVNRGAAYGTKNDCDNRKTYNNQYVVQ